MMPKKLPLSDSSRRTKPDMIAAMSSHGESLGRESMDGETMDGEKQWRGKRYRD